MKIYFIKLALRGVSPMIWRRFQISGNISLAALHKIIQLSFKWKDQHLHRFHIYGKDYGVSYIGGQDFNDDPYKVFIDSFNFDIGDKFIYEYNFYKSHFIDIRIEDIKETSNSTVIYCYKGNGVPRANETKKTELILKFLESTIYKHKMPSTKKIKSLIKAYDSFTFNRKKLNQFLHAENF